MTGFKTIVRQGVALTVGAATAVNTRTGELSYLVDARNYFDVAGKPTFTRNQFGATIGGPARQDKLFYFAGYEGLRENLGRTITSAVPDANARRGLPGQVAVTLGYASSRGYDLLRSNDLNTAVPTTGAAGAVLGGWRVSAIGTYRSGYPLTVFVQNNRSRSQWQPSLGPGIGRGDFRGPDLRVVDVALTKETALPMGDGNRIEVRLEVFNVFNRANFGVPDAVGPADQILIAIRYSLFAIRFSVEPSGAGG